MSDSSSLRFFLVDVFADEPLAGNPLAVVADADGLADEVMQRIARELNQSETTFVLRPTQEGAHWRLRSFTPAGVEVGGAGHNALGAWWWLAASGRVDLSASGGRFVQEIGSGLLPVAVQAIDGVVDSVAMQQSPPTFGPAHPDMAGLARALGLQADDLGWHGLAQVVSTGVAHLLVPARDRVAVQHARPDMERLAGELQAVGGEGCYLFCLEPMDPSAAAHARFFNPTVGIWEDPATGTAAGPLACHLMKAGLAAGPDIFVEQGHAVGRPSRIHLRVAGDDVWVHARAVLSAEGTLQLHRD